MMIILAAALLIFGLIITLSMLYVVNSRKKEDVKIKFNNSIIEKLEKIKLQITDNEMSEKIEDIISKLRNSDINTPPEARSAESRIVELLNNLNIDNTDKEIKSALKELSMLIEERNIISKNNKR